MGWTALVERPRWRPGVHLIVCVVALSVYLASHAVTWVSNWNDENVHLYTASRIADGLMPYRDIPSARPPLAILPLAGALRAGLPPLVAARTMVIVSHALTAILLLWVGRRLWGTAAGVASFFVFLAVAPAEHAFTGMSIVALWTTACVACTLLRRPWSAGICGGAALLSGQHALVLIAACAIVFLCQDRRALVRYVGSIASLAGISFGITFSICGVPAWEQLVGNHLYHLSGEPVVEGDLPRDLTVWFLDRLGVFLLASTGAVLSTAKPGCSRRSSSISTEWWLIFLVAIHLGCVLGMKAGQLMYADPVVPLLALAGGSVAGRLATAVRSEPTSDLVRLSHRYCFAVAILILGSTFAGWLSTSLYRELRDEEDYSLLPLLVRRQMAEIQEMVVADEIAAYVERSTISNQTLFGHATIVDLVAVKADRRVAAELADLPPRWFQMGIVSREDVVRRIEGDQVAMLITPRWFYFKDRYFRGYLDSCYDKPRLFPRMKGAGRGIPDILVFHRSEASRPCLPRPTRSGRGTKH